MTRRIEGLLADENRDIQINGRDVGRGDRMDRRDVRKDVRGAGGE